LADTDTMLDVGLDDWLDAPAAEPDWEPDGQADADRLLGVLRHLKRQLAEDAATAGRVVTETKAWQDSRAEVIRKRQERVEQMLEGWARMRHSWSGGRELTWKLPNGELKLRATQARCEVDTGQREDDVAAELVERGFADLVKIEHSLRRGEAKKAAKAGDLLADYPAPDGYLAHQAVATVHAYETGEQRTVVLPGVVLLVPMQERGFSAVPTPVYPPESGGLTR
jgi:hypothetical protein